MINRGQPLKRRSGFANTEGGISTRGGDNCLLLIRQVVRQYAGASQRDRVAITSAST